MNHSIKTKKLSGWGQYPKVWCQYTEPYNQQELTNILAQANEQGGLIPRGMGRSYGDSAVNINHTVSMTKFNHFLDFDAVNGLITVEAGVTLQDIINTLLRRGWFPIVTPGTKFVTVGGMIAADVHGKNHHQDSSFGSCVLWLDLMLADGNVIRCSEQQKSTLFKATIGGMGLTGIILRACFKLQKVESAWLQQEVITTRDLEETNNVVVESKNWPYIVSWIDSMASTKNLGRAVIFRAKHAVLDDLSDEYKSRPYAISQKANFNIFCNTPIGCINYASAKLLNKLVYAKNKIHTELIDYNSFFYPLDSLHNWNRLYGKSGFIQFQCLVPDIIAIKKLLKYFSNSKTACFLATLKLLANQESIISFPTEGYTLTLDIPASKKNIEVVKNLQQLVLECKGRFYLAKDSCLTAEEFYSSDARVQDFYNLRRKHKLADVFASEQSLRLNI